MSTEPERPAGPTSEPAPLLPPKESRVVQELEHLRRSWRWFLILGVILVVCGVIAIVYPVVTSLAAVSVVGVILLIAGLATLVSAFWAGKWSGFLIQLLVGILYLGAGVAVTERPVVTILMLTFFAAITFMVLGVFRAVGALVVRFSQWGWAMLNGLVTFICGLAIYRHWPLDAFWVVGVLVGLELLLNGLTWIMLARELRKGTGESSTSSLLMP